MGTVDGWIERVDRVEHRLAVAAGRGEERHRSQEAGGWTPPEVWGHLSEFVEFWIEEIGDVVDEYQGEPVAIGRAADDDTRLAGVEHGRAVPVDRLWQEVRSDLADLRAFLRALPEDRWTVVGVDSVRGEMDLEQLIEIYLISHLEEHVTQLEELLT